MAPYHILRILLLLRTDFHAVQDQVAQTRADDLRGRYHSDDANDARPKCLGQHADREDGQNARLPVQWLGAEFPNALPNQQLLHHFHLHHLLADYQRDPEALLRLY